MKCDIVIAVWNQLKVTKLCLESIKKNTNSPYRLIVVDNASDEKTKKYLESLKKDFPGMILKRNEKNLGFVKAINAGMQRSDAQYLLILNNDTIVTKNWLSEMISVADKNPKIGIVNPSSNNLGQKPPEGMRVETFAKKLESEKGKYVELGTALGFCMLIKKKVSQHIGYFDEVFKMGNFEDTDFSMRALREGYLVVRSCAAYVYHKENTSFRLMKTRREDFEENKKIFEARWGKPKRVLIVKTGKGELGQNILHDIDKILSRNGWIYIADKKGTARVKDHSRIKRYNFGLFFSPGVIYKILFKKKPFDEVYCDNGNLTKFLKKLNPKCKIYSL